MLRIAVIDTGIGIPEAMLGDVFREFVQVDTSLARRHAGTGLGLSIARDLAELMGGRIDLHSTPGRGTRVEVTLPFEAAPAETSTIGPATAGTRRRILLAEDNDTNAVVIETFLDGTGWSVVRVMNGQEAVALAERETFDLVLMDIAMPIMDGLEATRRIRAGGGASSRVPVIGVTATRLQDSGVETMAAGIDEVLIKPFRRSDLLTAIERWTALVAACPAGPRSFAAQA